MMYQHGQQLGLTSTHKFTLVAGVILPAIAITVEATTSVCAEMFFDPIPTSWHLLLVIMVPLMQLYVWLALRRNDPSRLRLAAVANALAIGISFFYSIVYLPLLPFAAITVLVALGLLPLAPFFALVTALIMRKQLRELAARAPRKSFLLTTKSLFAGLALVALFVTALELPRALTRHGLEMAVSNSPQERTKGIRFLRDYGSKDYLLRRCYDQRGRSLFVLGEFFSSDRPIKVDNVRDIFYRVTGSTFDEYAAPETVNSRPSLQNVGVEQYVDGTVMTGVVDGLSLKSSNLSGSVDAEGGVGHLDWAFEIENSLDSAAEIRAEVQLPPGAVVSRMTYSYGGVDREAEFTGHSPVVVPISEGYPVRRNLVLVSTAGRDRVAIKSYPVSGFHSRVKISLGITIPLVLQSKDQARLVLPHFIARNFQVPANVKHWVMIGSTNPLSSDYGLAVRSSSLGKDNGFQLLGQFNDLELMRPESALRVSRSERDHGIWSKNPFEMDGSIVKQSLEERTPAHLRRIVVVVDSSASMERWRSAISQSLTSLPPEMDIQLVVADADGSLEADSQKAVASGRDGALAFLSRLSFAGGADNAPALNKAWDLASATPGNNAIVWIHSPQRTALESIDSLSSRWQGRVYGPALYSVQTSIGPDVIEKKLDGFSEVKSVVRLGSLQSDLERLFQQLSGLVPTYEFVRSVKHPQTSPELEGSETSDHLARLWANDEVQRILSAHDDSFADAATMLALRYRLVTHATGAVIQDSNEQFDNGDLEPTRVPAFVTVKTTDFGSLFFLVFIFFVWLVIVKTRATNTGAVIP